MNKVVHSSKRHDWVTPQYLFDELDAEFHFTLDPCCTRETAKCEKYFTPEEDGLAQSWDGETVFCNPPYGRELVKWVKKSAESSGNGTTVVMLIPARTSNEWFHDYIYGKAEVRFIRGRVKFVGAEYNAPFPSMVVVFR